MTARYRYFVHTIIWVVALAGSAHSICSANTFPGLGFWNPGYVDYKFPLSWLAKPQLRTACTALTNGDFRSAQIAFSEELQKNPNDDASYVGLLQAIGSFTSIQSDHLASIASVSPTAANAFRSGAYALLFADKIYASGVPNQSDGDLAYSKLLPNAYTGLSTAFKLTHSILAGALLCQVNTYGATTTPTNREVVVESMVKGLCGEKIYEGYEAAKANEFHGQLPDVPQLSKDNNSILRRMVLDLWMFYGAVPGVFKNGAWSPAPETPLQNAAMEYLSAWAKKIGAANQSA